MADDISLPIKNILKNTLLYLIIDHTKIRKLLLIKMKTKYNALIL